MIGGWGKLALVHGAIFGLFTGIALFSEPNMFTLPMLILFATSTVYCGIQWLANRTIKKLETSR